MKRQFYLDDVERDLLRCSLELWRHRLTEPEVGVTASGHYYAKRFTLRRIKEMESRLQEPAEAKAAA